MIVFVTTSCPALPKQMYLPALPNDYYYQTIWLFDGDRILNSGLSQYLRLPSTLVLSGKNLVLYLM